MFSTAKPIIVALLMAVVGATGAAANDRTLTAKAAAAHQDVRGAIAAIDAWVEARRIYDDIPGISAGVVFKDRLIWSKGYGVSNLETRRPVDADTLYSICSISKLFTAISVMQLRDAGKLALRDPVASHLDWFDLKQTHAHSGPITIEGVLTHASGLPRESDFSYWRAPDFPFPTREEMIERLDAQETLYPANQYFQYSNLGLTLAGEIVEARSGQPYADYVEENILEPLGLSQTRPFYPERLRGEGLAIGYTGFDRSRARREVEPFFTRGITAAAGFTSSLNDLARFAIWQFELLQNKDAGVLAPNTLREMHRVHWIDPDWETTWGLGFSVNRVGDKTVVGHGGGCPGYITQFKMIPDLQIAAIVLTNAGDGPASNLSSNILKTMATSLQKASTTSKKRTPDLSKYEGNYSIDPWGGEFAVRQWGDHLVAINLPSDDLEGAMTKLKRERGDTFVRLADDGTPREPWAFEIGDDGRAARVLVHSQYSDRIK
ncbi:MAG: serine hydrolase [Pseudomonadota bacterium]